jgi:hypothetical protein
VGRGGGAAVSCWHACHPDITTSAPSGCFLVSWGLACDRISFFPLSAPFEFLVAYQLGDRLTLRQLQRSNVRPTQRPDLCCIVAFSGNNQQLRHSLCSSVMIQQQRPDPIQQQRPDLIQQQRPAAAQRVTCREFRPSISRRSEPASRSCFVMDACPSNAATWRGLNPRASW